MAPSTKDQDIIRGYLLGHLDDEEEQKIEERLMLEDDFFDEFEVSKGELVEQYRAGEFSKKEREWLESHYLASTEGRQRYMLAVALESQNHSRPVELSPPAPTLVQRVALWFKRQQWALASATVGLVIVIGAGLWFSRSAGSTFAGPTLASTMINRESGDLPPTIKLPADASALKLGLKLPQPSTPGVKYFAELDNKVDYTQAEVIGSDDKSVSVVISVSQLPPGEYALTLTAITSDGIKQKIPGQYLFNID